MKRLLTLFVFAITALTMPAQNNKPSWRAASPGDLQSLLPARATVEKEHIETEMRTASGITAGSSFNARFEQGLDRHLLDH